jgi:hypothetical protein
MLLKEIISAYTEKHTEAVNTKCRAIVASTVFGRWTFWQSPACGPWMNQEMKKGMKAITFFFFPPFPSSELLVTRSEVPIQIFQRRRTLTSPILCSGLTSPCRCGTVLSLRGPASLLLWSRLSGAWVLGSQGISRVIELRREVQIICWMRTGCLCTILDVCISPRNFVVDRFTVTRARTDTSATTLGN